MTLAQQIPKTFRPRPTQEGDEEDVRQEGCPLCTMSYSAVRPTMRAISVNGETVVARQSVTQDPLLLFVGGVKGACSDFLHARLRSWPPPHKSCFPQSQKRYLLHPRVERFKMALNGTIKNRDMDRRRRSQRSMRMSRHTDNEIHLKLAPVQSSPAPRLISTEHMTSLLNVRGFLRTFFW